MAIALFDADLFKAASDDILEVSPKGLGTAVGRHFMSASDKIISIKNQPADLFENSRVSVQRFRNKISKIL